MILRRNAFKRPRTKLGTGLRGKPIKRSTGKIKRNKPIPKLGKSPVSVVKRDIQKQLRLNAIERDKTCVISQHLDDVPENWKVCGKLRKDGELIVQAEHLCSRAQSACYADMDNIVLVCMRHHFYFKTQRAPIYWDIIRKHIGEERWAKVKAWEKDTNVYRRSAEDWRNILKEITPTTLLEELQVKK